MATGLFGQKYSSRDYTDKQYWGKNQFNSSFPASLVAYMWWRRMSLVYLNTDTKGNIRQGSITAKSLFGIDPLSDDAYYNFEAGFPQYETFYTGKRETIDLVMMERTTGECLSGLEVKLTAIPDSTTIDRQEDEYSCELVVRPPTVCFLACGISSYYEAHKLRAPST